jgi:GTP-binding protein Era
MEDKMGQEFKSGFVTLVGRPNVGKSTLMNQMIGQKIAITSNKPQTTRNQIQTVYHDERGQIVFLDTPGIHKAKNKLGEYMVGVAEKTFSEVDLVLWLVEATTFIGRGERYIAEELKQSKAPVILVMNKIDTIKKDELLECIAAYKDMMEFAEIIPVSAWTGENVDELITTMFSYLEEPRTHVNIRHQPGVPSAELQEWLAVDPESHFEHFAKEQQGPDAPNFVYLPRCAGTHE